MLGFQNVVKCTITIMFILLISFPEYLRCIRVYKNRTTNESPHFYLSNINIISIYLFILHWDLFIIYPFIFNWLFNFYSFIFYFWFFNLLQIEFYLDRIRNYFPLILKNTTILLSQDGQLFSRRPPPLLLCNASVSKTLFLV